MMESSDPMDDSNLEHSQQNLLPVPNNTNTYENLNNYSETTATTTTENDHNVNGETNVILSSKTRLVPQKKDNFDIVLGKENAVGINNNNLFLSVNTTTNNGNNDNVESGKTGVYPLQPTIVSIPGLLHEVVETKHTSIGVVGGSGTQTTTSTSLERGNEYIQQVLPDQHNTITPSLSVQQPSVEQNRHDVGIVNYDKFTPTPLANTMTQTTTMTPTAYSTSESTNTPSQIPQQQENFQSPIRKQQYSVATVSAPWQYDDCVNSCLLCNSNFVPVLNGRHHCRLCGNIFCNTCSGYRALIPPTRIVLVPKGGKKVKPPTLSTTLLLQNDGRNSSGGTDSDVNNFFSFDPDPDPDGMLTYIAAGSSNNSMNGNDNVEQLLYGKGLEQRITMARQPLRVCRRCYDQLLPIQEELRNTNSNAVRFNYIDPSSNVRLLNSPMAFTLGHEIRKAAYALNNLLPLPKRRVGAIVMTTSDMYHPMNVDNLNVTNEIQQCQENCVSLSPNLGSLDGVRIPAKLLERAKGIAVLTVLKGGFGIAGAEFGTGLVVAKLPNLGENNQEQQAQQAQNSSTATQLNSWQTQQQQQRIRWSAPSAIGTAGLSWGALIGAQVSDHVFLLMTDAAVEIMFAENASVQLGVDIGVAVGPLGRAVEGDVGVGANQPPAPIYTYSLSKGLYAGVSLDGKIIGTRHSVNEKFYGYKVTGKEILSGAVPTPPAAQPLYEALARCHVYALNNNPDNKNNTDNTNNTTRRQQQQHQIDNCDLFPQQIPYLYPVPTNIQEYDDRNNNNINNNSNNFNYVTAEFTSNSTTTAVDNNMLDEPIESPDVMGEYGEVADRVHLLVHSNRPL